MLSQRAGLARGLKPVRQHRSKLGKYRKRLEYLAKDIIKARKKGNRKKLKQLRVTRARVQQKLKRLEAKDRKEFFRKRKDAERGNMPAWVFDEGAKVSETHVTLPGGHRLKFRKPLAIPEGYEITGAVRIVDVTRRVTRVTEPQHRRFRTHITLKKAAPVPKQPKSKSDLLGIDVGKVVPVYTSSGQKIYLKDDAQEQESDARIRYLNRCISKHKPGSRRHKKQTHQRKKAERKRTNRRKNASRHAAKEVTDHAQEEGCVMIVAEDLNHNNMRASAKGTEEYHGSNVSAKRALNDQLGRAAMGRLLSDVQRRCLLLGIGFLTVPPHGTSQNCHECGTSGGRENQADFRCSQCGWSGNADHNAAINMLDKGWAAVGKIVERRPGVTNKQTSQTTLSG